MPRRTLVQGVRLYLKDHPTLKYNYIDDESIEEGYNLLLWYEKLDDEEFGWWCRGKRNPDVKKEDHTGVRMDSDNVYSKYMSHFQLYFPNDWKIKTRVKHKSINVVGTINKILYFNDVPYIGVYWDHGQKSKYAYYYWNRFDKLKIL